MPAIGRRTGLAALQPGLEWARRVGFGVVLGNASSLSATAIITSGLGFLFWSYAARTASPADVGLAAAAVSATGLLAVVSMLGFGTLLIGEIAAGSPGQGALVSTALLVVAVVGGVLGIMFAVIGPNVLHELTPLHVGLLSVGLFALAAGGTAVGLLVDQLMVGLLRGELQLVRNALYSVAKLALLVVAMQLPSDKGLAIFATWPLGNLVSIVAVWVLVAYKPIGVQLERPRMSLLKRLWGAALGHHSLNLSLQAPSMILPVLVTVLISSTANAYFYAAWMIATVAFVPQTALAVTLFAVAARQPSALVSRVRMTLVLGLAEGILAIAVAFLIADRLLGVFGAAYAAEASASLRILIVAIIPIVIKVHFVALSRVRRRTAAASGVLAAGAVLELVCAAAGARMGGIPGLSAGWLLGMSLEAAYMAPTVWRTARPNWHRLSPTTTSSSVESGLGG